MRVFIQGTRGEGHFGQRDRKKERPEVRNRMEKAVMPGEERTHKQFHVIFNLRHKGSGKERIYVTHKIFYTHIHCMYIYLQYFIFTFYVYVLSLWIMKFVLFCF